MGDMALTLLVLAALPRKSVEEGVRSGWNQPVGRVRMTNQERKRGGRGECIDCEGNKEGAWTQSAIDK